MKRNMKVKFSIGIILCLIILIVISLIFPNKKFVSETLKSNNALPFEKIKNGDVIEQKFISSDNYEKVGVLFANYNQIINTGSLKLEIINKGKKTIKKINQSNTCDNSYYYIPYKFKKNENYTIKIFTDNLSNPITFYTTDAVIKGASLKYNGNDVDKNILLSFVKKEKDYFNIWYYMFGIVIISCYMILINRNKE